MNKLVDALTALLPGAELVSWKPQAWHSATFSGERAIVRLRLAGADAARRATTFAEALPDAEFALSRQLVADIMVSEIASLDDGVELVIEALLLDE